MVVSVPEILICCLAYQRVMVRNLMKEIKGILKLIIPHLVPELWLAFSVLSLQLDLITMQPLEFVMCNKSCPLVYYVKEYQVSYIIRFFFFSPLLKFNSKDENCNRGRPLK